MDPDAVREAIRRLVESDQAALAQFVWDQYRRERADGMYSQTVTDLGPRPEVPDEGPTLGERAKDVAVQAIRGPAVAVTAAGQGLADLLGMDQTAANLRARRAAIEEITGEPKTGLGLATGVGSRILGEGALFALPGAGLRVAGQGARILGAATRTPELMRRGRALLKGGGLGRDLALGALVDAPLEAGMRPEESLAGFLGFEEASQTPFGRVAVGVPAGAAAAGVLGSFIGLERGARARATANAERARAAALGEGAGAVGEGATGAVAGGVRAPVRVSDIEPSLPREQEFDVQVQDIAPDEVSQARIGAMKERAAEPLTTPQERAQVELQRRIEAAREAGQPMSADDIVRQFESVLRAEERVLSGSRRGVAEVEAAAARADPTERVAASAEQLTRFKREAEAARRMATKVLDDAEELPAGSAEWMRAQEEADRLFAAFDDMSAHAIEGLSESARAMAIHRWQVATMGLLESPSAWMQQAKRTMGRKLTTAERNQVRRWFTSGNRDAMARWTYENREAVRMNDPRFYAQFIKSMFLLPFSVGRAGAGNAARAAVDLAGRPAATWFDQKVAAGITGREVGLQTTPGVAGAWARGIWGGLKEIPQVVTRGIGPGDVQKLDLRHYGKRLESPVQFTYKGTTYDVVDGLAQVPYRMLAIVDRPFAGPAYLGTLVELGEASARAAGKTGDDFTQAVQRFVSDPPPDATALASFTADVAAARQETFFGRAAQRFKQGIAGPTVTGGQKIPSRSREAGAEVLLPFTTAPGAVTQLALDTNPVTGAAQTVFDIRRLARLVDADADPATIRELQRMASKRFGRWTTGAAVGMALGWKAAADGRYSGGYPESGAERDQFIRAGRKPYSFLLDDDWVPATQAYPWSTAMVFGAEIGDAMRRGENPFVGVAAGTMSILPQIAESPFVQGPARMSAATESDEGMRRFVTQTAGSLVPNPVATTARLVDPVRREAGGPLSAMARRIPDLSKQLPERLDPFTGEPRRPFREGENVRGVLGPGAVFGAGPAWAFDDPMIAEFERLEFAPSRITKRRDESDEQFRERLQREGPILANTMRAVTLGRGEEAITTLLQGLVAEFGENVAAGSRGQFNTLFKNIRDYQMLKDMEQTPAIMEYQRFVLGDIVGRLKSIISPIRQASELQAQLEALTVSPGPPR